MQTGHPEADVRAWIEGKKTAAPQGTAVFGKVDRDDLRKQR